MNWTVVNHKEVKNDILFAKDWYRSRQKGLEKRFSSDIKNTLNYIIKNPFLFQVKYQTVRSA